MIRVTEDGVVQRGGRNLPIGASGVERAELRADLLKWMFVYWAGTALTVIGLLKL